MPDQVYMVLFRGVGGETKLPVKPLQEALTKAGFRHVRTYIATGNVVLLSNLSAEAVQNKVVEIAKKTLGFSKAVIVMARKEWAAVVKGNPFAKVMGEPRTLHVFALEAEPSKAEVRAVEARAAGGPNGIKVKGRALYLHTPDGFGRSGLPAIIERTLSVATTARNWNTVLKLEEFAKEAEALSAK